ncbi:MAG: hypothetical protein ACFB2Z_13900 [Maricaulaceae bacterium]
MFKRGLMALAGLGASSCALFESGEELPNPGPCPAASILSDAGRVVNFEGEDTLFRFVGFTGEIEDVQSRCRYFADKPINADLAITFSFGRGPAALDENTHQYNYFVTVTRRNVAIIKKEVYPLNVVFPKDEQIVQVTEVFDEIIIPRINDRTSGNNFEILVGFELTDEQLEFNRSGRRFRIDAATVDP